MTVASLPRGLEWQEWFQYHRDEIHEGQPWVRFLVDATTTLQQLHVTTSRILRKKPNWETAGWSQEEWMPIVEVAEEKLSWFEKNKPRSQDVPPWAGILLEAIGGSMKLQVRIAKEVSQIQRKGHLLINVSPLETGDLNGRGEEIE